MYTLLCIQVHFSISHPIQRICPSYLMLVNSTCGLFHHFPHFFSQSLLDEPNPNSPANSQAAQLYQENKREYEKRVTAIVEQSWVDVWASEPLYYFLSIPPLIIPVLQSFIFYLVKEEKNTATLSEELKCHPEKKRKIETTKPEWTLTCLPIHLRKTREGKSILYLCFFF